MALRDKALASLLGALKAQERAKDSIGAALHKIIDDYSMSGEFDKYISKHADRLAHYTRNQETERRGRHRASSAGKCVQEQAFELLQKVQPGVLHSDTIARPAHQTRALANGTFVHMRYHLLFDALHEAGIVRTLFVEDLRYNGGFELSGTVDRVVEFEFSGKLVRAVIDYKSMKSRYYNELIEPKTDHTLQQHAYRFFGYGADVWIMIYENKDTHELKIYDRGYSSAVLDTLQLNYAQIDKFVEAVLDQHSHQPLPKLPLTTTWCGWCQWQTECLKLNPDRDKK